MSVLAIGLRMFSVSILLFTTKILGIDIRKPLSLHVRDICDLTIWLLIRLLKARKKAAERTNQRMPYSYSSSTTMENRWQDALNSRLHFPLAQRNFCEPGITPSVSWAGPPYPSLPLFSCVVISVNSQVLHGDDSSFLPLGTPTTKQEN